MDRVFSPADIDPLIPKLEQIFQHIDFFQTRIRKLAAGRPQAEGTIDAAQIAESARIHAQMQFLMLDIQSHMAQISLLGGVVKDLDAGLVDFPGRVNGEDVWLCWKRGETRVEFWHPLYAGFSQRQRIYSTHKRIQVSHSHNPN